MTFNIARAASLPLKNKSHNFFRASQRRVLKACHSEPTSGHFGVTKTYKRTAERVHIFQRKSSGGSIFIKRNRSGT